jgi:hypothetical protein
MSEKQNISDEILMNRNYKIRDQKVMLDKDLAELYDVKPIRLREQVKRNPERFPLNFMFQLSPEEALNMVSQNAIPSKQQLGGTLPYAFTEHGILMLSNVLRSERGIAMSIRIIELFVKFRETMFLHKDVSMLLEQVEKRMGKQDQKIDDLFNYLNKFVKEKEVPRTMIGFKTKPPEQ